MPACQMPWLRKLWIVLYVLFLAVIPCTAFLRHGNPVDIIIAVMNGLLINFAPKVALWLTDKMGLQTRREERVLTVHCAITLASTVSFASAVIVLTPISASKGAGVWGVYCVLSALVIAFGMGGARIAPSLFFGKDAHLNQPPTHSPYIYPDTIAAPITWFRIALMVLTAFLPLARTAIHF